MRLVHLIRVVALLALNHPTAVTPLLVICYECSSEGPLRVHGIAVDASTTIIKLALLTTGWQGALEVVAVGLDAVGRKIKAASNTITTGILRERK
jgi:hypothetical protein